VQPTPHTTRVQPTREEGARYLTERLAATAAELERQARRRRLQRAVDAAGDEKPALHVKVADVEGRGREAESPALPAGQVDRRSPPAPVPGELVDLLDAVSGYARRE
jgi:hypothetical protein